MRELQMEEQILQALNSLDKRLAVVEEKLSQIPIPFKLMYKPDYLEKHINLVEYLDHINKRLEQIENGKTSCDIWRD